MINRKEHITNAFFIVIGIIVIIIIAYLTLPEIGERRHNKSWEERWDEQQK